MRTIGRSGRRRRYYRGTNGAVQGFLGGNERMGAATSYRFFSKDRDVFYNGDGPRRDFTLSSGPAKEQVMNITWGADAPSAIGGRYILVSRHSGKAADVAGFSYNDGGNVQQWTNYPGMNQLWVLEYVTNGWFNIRNGWSGKYLDVYGISTADGANIDQWAGNGGLNQQWRLVPVSALSPTNITTLPALTGVTAIANPLSVKLSWNVSAASDLAGYTVLRSTINGGPYEIVARGLTANSFTDKFANQNKTYYHIVKATDKSLNTSTNSAQVSATPTAGPTLVARYSFDGTTNDSSGNANHPILTYGGPTFVAGKYGSALNLSGSGQYTMLPAGMFASVTNFTIAAWVYWNGGAAWQRIFDCGNDTTQYMFLSPSSGSGTLRFAITTNGPGAEQIVQTSPLPAGQWQHVAVTRTGNTARLYTNGVLAVSGTVTIVPASFNPALNFLRQSQYPADPLFNGRLDEMFIYNYALSNTEITRLLNNQPPPPVMPTTLSAILTGNTLNLSWSSNYLGCRLQVQTNSLNAGLGTNWFDVTGSTLTNSVVMPVNSGNISVFYRLIYP